MIMIGRRDFLKTSLFTVSAFSLYGCRGGNSGAQSVETVTTTTKPRLFDDFRNSPAYTNRAYQEFVEVLDLDKSIVIPGLERTVAMDRVSSKMTPQGLCFAGDYVLISAYDSNSPGINSVIYVLSNRSLSDRVLLTVLSLPTTGHVGGLAYDGENVWVCDGNTMGVLKYASITSIVDSGVKSAKIFYSSVWPVLTTASFATFHDGMVFVGQFNESDVGDMYGYEIRFGSTETPELHQAIKIEVPKQTQGVAFDVDGLMIVSTSYGRNNDAHLRFYRPDWGNPTGNNFVYKRNALKILTIPTMSEAVVIVGDYAYILFESASRAYYDPQSLADNSENPVDRVLAFKPGGIVGS